MIIRLLIVDDHLLIREAMCAVLQTLPDIEVVGVAGDGVEALAMAARSEPDVVLMDLAMPRLDGVAATLRLLQAQPAVRVVAWTSAVGGRQELAALAAGAVAVVYKDADSASVIDAVRAAAATQS